MCRTVDTTFLKSNNCFSYHVLYKKVVVECVQDSLSMYGESMKAAMILHLKREGISFVPEEFDIGKFCTAINSMLGSWSDFIFMKVTDDICKKTNISLDELGLGYRSRHLPYSAVLKEVVVKVRAV